MLGSGGGEWGGGNSWLGSVQQRSWRAALWVVRFVLCFLLIGIVVAAVPSVCCSVKLPLSRPTSFCLVLSILLHTPGLGGVATWCFCCRPQLNYNRGASKFFLVLQSDFKPFFFFSSVVLFYFENSVHLIINVLLSKRKLLEKVTADL